MWALVTILLQWVETIEQGNYYKRKDFIVGLLINSEI